MEILAEKIGAFEILFLVICFRKTEIEGKLLFPVCFRYSCKFHMGKHESFPLYIWAEK